MSACDHHESLWGRCSACGKTWAQQIDEMRGRSCPLIDGCVTPVECAEGPCTFFDLDETEAPK